MDDLHEFPNGVRVKPKTLKMLHVMNLSTRRIAAVLGVNYHDYEDAMVEHFYDPEMYDSEVDFRTRIRN